MQFETQLKIEKKKIVVHLDLLVILFIILAIKKVEKEKEGIGFVG